MRVRGGRDDERVRRLYAAELGFPKPARLPKIEGDERMARRIAFGILAAFLLLAIVAAVQNTHPLH